MLPARLICSLYWRIAPLTIRIKENSAPHLGDFFGDPGMKRSGPLSEPCNTVTGDIHWFEPLRGRLHPYRLNQMPVIPGPGNFQTRERAIHHHCIWGVASPGSRRECGCCKGIRHHRPRDVAGMRGNVPVTSDSFNDLFREEKKESRGSLALQRVKSCTDRCFVRHPGQFN